MAQLVGVHGMLEGRRFPLKEQVLVGRCPEADIHLLDAMVTRRHCLLSAGPQGYVIEDLGSRNGTFVNGAAVMRPTPFTMIITYSVNNPKRTTTYSCILGR